MIKHWKLTSLKAQKSLAIALAMLLPPRDLILDQPVALATPPIITGQPQSDAVCEGGSFTSGRANFFCGASGTQPLSYQWRRGTTNLANGGNISGANTYHLVIWPAAPTDADDDYNCVVTNLEGSAVSNNAALSVFPTGTGDINGDGSADGRDVQAFVDLWFGPPPESLTASQCAAAFGWPCEDLCVFAQILLDSSLGCGVPPENDDCANAVVITTDVLYNGSTFFATRDGPAVSCEVGCSPACGLSPDVWFQWVADFTGLARFSLCDLAGYDTILTVYNGCPAIGGTELFCNDDACGTRSALCVGVSMGQTYWIRISGWANAKGCFTLRVSSAPFCG